MTRGAAASAGCFRRRCFLQPAPYGSEGMLLAHSYLMLGKAEVIGIISAASRVVSFRMLPRHTDPPSSHACPPQCIRPRLPASPPSPPWWTPPPHPTTYRSSIPKRLPSTAPPPLKPTWPAMVDAPRDPSYTASTLLTVLSSVSGVVHRKSSLPVTSSGPAQGGEGDAGLVVRPAWWEMARGPLHSEIGRWIPAHAHARLPAARCI